MTKDPYKEYLEVGAMPKNFNKPRCPYAHTRLAGDETYEVCEINGKFCLLESGDVCETYEETLAELAEEAEDETSIC